MTRSRFARPEIVPLVLAISLAGWPAAAQEVMPDPDGEMPELPSGPLDEERPPAEGEILSDTEAEDETAARIEKLFSELRDPKNERWEQAEQAIWRAWSRSGSASMDLLLRRAEEAAQAGDVDLSMQFLNDLTRLAPDFAEGWNKRATMYFIQGDLGRSVADIGRVLALEPRHFGALTGLAVILEETGNEAGALRAWRRALEIHPHLEGATESVDRLVPKVEGRRL